MDFKSRTEIGSSFRLSPGMTTTRAELTSSVARTTRVRPRAHPAGHSTPTAYQVLVSLQHVQMGHVHEACGVGRIISPLLAQ